MPRTTITNKMVKQIRDMFKEGHSYKVIVEAVGVSRCTVYKYSSPERGLQHQEYQKRRHKEMYNNPTQYADQITRKRESARKAKQNGK